MQPLRPHDPAAALPIHDILAGLGIAPGQATPPYWGAMQDCERVCASCASLALCRRAIRAGTATRDYAAFCPNADVLGEMEAAQAGGLVTDRV